MGTKKQAALHLLDGILFSKTLSSCYCCYRCFQSYDVNGLIKFALKIL